MTDVVIVSAARTAVGKFGGSLAKVAAPVGRDVIARRWSAQACSPIR
jgi:acetyl-CoA acetyltransferase